MSAYIVIEGTPRDKEALSRYASQAIPSIKTFGGEVIVFGPWELLFGESAYHNGMIIRFSDKEAVATYRAGASNLDLETQRNVLLSFPRAQLV
jgi:uncharacterized protein (DUF1330 family)